MHVCTRLQRLVPELPNQASHNDAMHVSLSHLETLINEPMHGATELPLPPSCTHLFWKLIKTELVILKLSQSIVQPFGCTQSISQNQKIENVIAIAEPIYNWYLISYKALATWKMFWQPYRHDEPAWKRHRKRSKCKHLRAHVSVLMEEVTHKKI